jgi:hypothetical protein
MVNYEQTVRLTDCKAHGYTEQTTKHSGVYGLWFMPSGGAVTLESGSVSGGAGGSVGGGGRGSQVGKMTRRVCAGTPVHYEQTVREEDAASVL